ncbi:KEOPS complex subunit Pcc1 [Candidatus Halobonum tyrrellensis]|uniref:Rpo operon protein n=1 Tax=Candidatus Halobonum tyrrellensis G22 TaxID=1324957 RepID=V4HIR7_9EURY|nr:KEOPS complex subunit Pcc1 [Candidatus Halobonum tyrrellensis]ESP89688.1 rpo operon protein [Candidatus Halobonum tyrrellensis G22]
MTPAGPADADGRTHRAVLSFPYDDERRARAVHEAVAVEAGAIDDDRSTARAARDGDTVEVSVRASDLVALRASTNTWARLVRAAEDAAAAADDARAAE